MKVWLVYTVKNGDPSEAEFEVYGNKAEAKKVLEDWIETRSDDPDLEFDDNWAFSGDSCCEIHEKEIN